jgi:hypothetical protein
VSKYGSRKTLMDGIMFDSIAEAKYYAQLKLLRACGDVKEFELQPTYVLQEGYKRGNRKVQPITYKADFLVTYKDGRKEVIDVKGMRTPVYMLKKKMFEFKYPELEIVEVSA